MCVQPSAVLIVLIMHNLLHSSPSPWEQIAEYEAVAKVKTPLREINSWEGKDGLGAKYVLFKELWHLKGYCQDFFKPEKLYCQ